MLTCKVGKNIVNTIDYSDEQLRKWHKKDILRCQICNYPMYYRNGEIKVAYFAHQPGSDCIDTILGSEPETEEHRQSIKDIYLYLKNQKEVSDIVLESWIPETKQRPDITFIYKGEKYAIEVQCSPLATEYLERHRLYKLAGVKDIWILGINKYKDNITTDGYFKTKVIERQILYKEDQRLMYYDCDNKQMNIVTENNIKAILDRKTTFNFKFIKKSLNEISLDKLLKETFYEQNKKTILNLVKKIIEPQCNEIQYNFHVNILNKNIVAYFLINDKKYCVDYIPEYISLKDYNDIVKQYKELNIKPFIFLNYDFYKGIQENVSFISDYYREGQNLLPFEKCMNINMFFVYKNKIKFFTNNKNITLKKMLKNKIGEYRCYCKNYNDFAININHKKVLDNQKIKEKINIVTNNIINRIKEEILSPNKLFQSFDIDDIIFNKGNIISKKIYDIYKNVEQSRQQIYNILFIKIVRSTYKYLDKININTCKEKELFNQFKNRIKEIFDKNKIYYNLNYSLKDEDGQVYDNLIYFYENNKKYIMYTNNKLLHNNDEMDLSNAYNKNTIFIRLDNIKKYIKNNWVLCRNYYGTICVDFIEDIIKININYEYPKIRDSVDINLFYKNNHKKINKNIKYYYLPRYNFVEMISNLQKIKEDIYNLICQKKIHIEKNNINYNLIYDYNNINQYQIDSTVIDKNINKKIKNYLYPITTFLKNHDNIRDLNIMLNPKFTIQEEKGYELWKIKNFINILEELHIYNFINIIDDYYEED